MVMIYTTAAIYVMLYLGNAAAFELMARSGKRNSSEMRGKVGTADVADSLL